GGHEVALDDERGFNALSRARDAFHLAQRMSQLNGRHGLPCQHAERLRLEGSQAARCGIKHEQRAHANACGCVQRGRCIKAERAAGKDNAVRRELGVFARVGDFIDVLRAQRRIAGECSGCKFSFAKAMASIEPDAVRACERDARGGSSADPRGQLGKVVYCGIGRGAEHLVFVQGLQAQAFAARYVALGRRAVHLIPFMVGDGIDANTGTFGELAGTSGIHGRKWDATLGISPRQKCQSLLGGPYACQLKGLSADNYATGRSGCPARIVYEDAGTVGESDGRCVGGGQGWSGRGRELSVVSSQLSGDPTGQNRDVGIDDHYRCDDAERRADMKVARPWVTATGFEVSVRVAGLRPSRLAVTVMEPAVRVERTATRL